MQETQEEEQYRGGYRFEYVTWDRDTAYQTAVTDSALC